MAKKLPVFCLLLSLFAANATMAQGRPPGAGQPPAGPVADLEAALDALTSRVDAVEDAMNPSVDDRVYCHTQTLTYFTTVNLRSSVIRRVVSFDSASNMATFEQALSWHAISQDESGAPTISEHDLAEFSVPYAQLGTEIGIGTLTIYGSGDGSVLHRKILQEVTTGDAVFLSDEVFVEIDASSGAVCHPISVFTPAIP